MIKEIILNILLLSLVTGRIDTDLLLKFKSLNQIIITNYNCLPSLKGNTFIINDFINFNQIQYAISI